MAKITTTGSILKKQDKVSIDITFEPFVREELSYGFGQLTYPVGGISYFDAFDVTGIKLGYMIQPLNWSYGENVFGYGRELTTSIREGIDVVTALVKVTPPNRYKLKINTNGPGRIFSYFDEQTGAYVPQYLPGRKFTYEPMTDDNGLLTVKLSVPMSGKQNNYEQKNLNNLLNIISVER